MHSSRSAGFALAAASAALLFAWPFCMALRHSTKASRNAWNHEWCIHEIDGEEYRTAPNGRHQRQLGVIDAVIVPGISGLGNNLFQVAAAVFYAETYGARIVLDAASPVLRWGTAGYTNRDKTRRSLRGRRLSYFDTLFHSPNLCWITDAAVSDGAGSVVDTWPGPVTRVNNDYAANRFVPLQGTSNAPRLGAANKTTLHLTGFHQHRDLFLPALPRLPFYLNLDAGLYTRALLRTRYGLYRGQHHAIMLGVRRGADFAHMTKVGVGAYERALRAVFETRASHATPWTLVILADTDVSDMHLGERASAIASDVSAGHTVRTVIVAEDDITQMHAGLVCDYFILSESTFHYWIAVLREVVPPRRQGVQVVVFENTDLTNRSLALDGWTRLPYE
jgi:hypothetical protein